MQLQQNITTHKAELSAIRKERELLKTAAANNGSAADSTKALLESTSAEIDRLKDKLAALQADLDAKTEAHEQAMVEIEVIQGQLDTANQKAQAAVTEAIGAQSANEVELEHAHTLIGELRKQLDEARTVQASAEAEATEQRIAASEKEIRSEALVVQINQLLSLIHISEPTRPY